MSGRPSPFMSIVVTPSAWAVPRRWTKKVCCGTPYGPSPGVFFRSSCAEPLTVNATSVSVRASVEVIVFISSHRPALGDPIPQQYSGDAVNLAAVWFTHKTQAATAADPDLIIILRKIERACRFNWSSFDVLIETGSASPADKPPRSWKMKFLCIYKPAKPEGGLPTPEDMARMGAYIEESMKSGVLLATEGCMPSALGARVRRTDGRFAVVDGPFTEAKEVIGGFALINANSKHEAVEITRSFMNVAGDGETEIRQIYEVPECFAPRVPQATETVHAG